MKLINLGGNGSLVDQYLLELRDQNIQQDRHRFRYNLQRLGEIMAYEISKQMTYSKEDVVTTLGIANVLKLQTQPIIATILRAGLPFHQGFINFFDKADCSFIAGYRKYAKNDDFEIMIDYISSPQISNKTLILNDPMLATGASLELTYRSMLDYGEPSNVHIATIIASREGLEYLQRKLLKTNITVWVCAIDEELTVKSYIVPGLGDAGDLAFGTKIDF